MEADGPVLVRSRRVAPVDAGDERWSGASGGGLAGDAAEFTFDYAPRPGVRLRRTFALFDEVGAIADPEHADIGLMEDLDTGRTPPLEDARDGYLDL